MSNNLTVGHGRAATGGGGQVFVVDKSAHDRRVSELLAANNVAVEKRRAATALLKEAAALFRTYEGHHRAKITEAGRPEKAERNAEIAARIETFLSEIHA